MTHDKLLTTDEAAEQLGLDPGTLAHWRCRETGPAFVRLGRAVRYRPADIDSFVATNTHAVAR